MANLKEQAIEILYHIPDDKMIYVIDVLKSLNNIFYENKSINVSDDSSERLEAWERFKKYKGIIPCDIDVKAELAKARDEKYADFIWYQRNNGFYLKTW